MADTYKFLVFLEFCRKYYLGRAQLAISQDCVTRKWPTISDAVILCEMGLTVTSELGENSLSLDIQFEVDYQLVMVC